MRKKYRYQSGGERRIPGPIANDPSLLPRVVTDPKEVVRMYFVDNSRPGDISTYFKLPGAIPVEDLQQKMAREQAKRVALAKEEEKKKKAKIPPAPIKEMKGDIATYFKLPNDALADLSLQKGIADHQYLQRSLERLGYSKNYAEIFARQGRDRLSKNMQDQLEELEQGDYRVQHHPDYNPNKPIEQQQYLNFDNSLKTRLLRGRNMLLDSGNPVVDFATDIATYPGKAFVNMSMDAEKQYFQPGPLQGALNFGTDVLALFPTPVFNTANKVAGRMVGRNIPEAAVIMERSLGRPGATVAAEQPLFAMTPGVRSGVSVPVPRSLEGLKFGSNPAAELADFEQRVYGAAMDYASLIKDPRYLERVKVLDKELGLKGELQRRHASFVEQINNYDNATRLPFNIRVGEVPLNAAGVSRPIPGVEGYSEVVKNAGKAGIDLNKKPRIGLYKSTDYYTPQQREIVLSSAMEDVGYPASRITPHELKHHWTNALTDHKGNIQEYAKWLSESTVERPNAAFMKMKHKVARYHLDPAEIDSYLMTNFRDDLVKQGYMQDHFSDLTKDQLIRFIQNNKDNILVQKYFSPGKELVWDKNKFLNVFNKALPIAIPGIIGVAAANENVQEETDKYQEGGEKDIRPPMVYDLNLLPKVITDPREVIKAYYVDNSGPGDIPSYFKLPNKEPRLLQKKPVEKKEQKKLVPIPANVITSDMPGYYKSSKTANDLRLEQYLSDQQKLQHQLVRLGYPESHARVMVKQGRSKLAENVRERLEQLEADDYRVQHHPDYDPSRPIERQQYLNYDNSLKTMLLRGRNMMLDSGNPVIDFATNVATYPGKAFINMTMDAERQYIDPGAAQGLLNFGTDVLSLFPSTPYRAANIMVNRASPKALAYMSQPLVQGTEDLGKWYMSKAAKSGTVAKHFPEHAAFARNVSDQLSRGMPLKEAIESSYRSMPDDVISQVNLFDDESAVEVYKKMTQTFDDLPQGKIWYNEDYSLDSYPLMLNHLKKRLGPDNYKIVPTQPLMGLNEYGFKSASVLEALPAEIQENYRKRIKLYDGLIGETRTIAKQIEKIQDPKEAWKMSTEWNVKNNYAEMLKESLKEDLYALVNNNPAVRDRLIGGFNEQIKQVNQLYNAHLPMASVAEDAIKIPQFYIYKKDPSLLNRLNALPRRLGLSSNKSLNTGDKSAKIISNLPPPWY